MSETVIKDGAGQGAKAQVKANNKLSTDSLVFDRSAYISDSTEQSYLVSTGGFINITSTGTETGILYLKYTGTKALYITSIRTCGMEAQKWLMYKDSTTGTLITNGTAASIKNTNLRSSNELSATALYGANGRTVTNGTTIDNWINHSGHSIEELAGVVILGKNNSVTLTCEVMTATEVCVRILCFEDDIGKL